jgi:hypothetical protein
MQEIKQELVKHGVNLSGRAVQTRLIKAQQQAIQEADERYPDKRKQNAHVIGRIERLLGWLAVFFVGVFLVGGNLFALVMFPIAEFVAVRAGIMAFEPHATIATLSSAVVVVGLVSLLFIRNLLRDSLPDNLPVPALSLRRSWQGLRHFVQGTGAPETLQSETLYLAACGAVTILQLVIVLLGFMGRVRDAMTASAVNGEAYYVFVARLFVDASAVEFVGYIGTLALTVALLKVTDLVILFIYRVFVSTAGSMTLDADGSEVLRNRFLMQRVRDLQAQALEDLLLQVQNKPTE